MTIAAREIEDRRTLMVGFACSEKLKEQVEEYARSNGVSRSAAIREFVERGCKEYFSSAMGVL